VPENATHFLTNSEGFQPEWAGKHAQVEMQRIFLEYQVSQEEAFKAFAKLHPTKRSILLLDCCTLNSKVYVNDEQWEQVLALPGHELLSEQQLFSRYDLVIHMVSCAFEGLYEWGPGSNNPGRYHSPEEAKDCDKRSLDVFANHPQVRVVPHFPDFDSKMQQVLHFLNDALHIDGLTGKRRRREVRVKDTVGLLAVAAQATTTSFLVTSTFLDEQLERSLRRRATVPNQIWVNEFRKLSSNDELCRTQSYDDIEALRDDGQDVIYEQRSQKYARNSGGKESYLTRRLIKADDYYAAESDACGKYSTVKFVIGFVSDHKYYELFFFSGYKDPVLDMPDDLQALPEWLELTEDVDAQEAVSPVIAPLPPPCSDHGELQEPLSPSANCSSDGKVTTPRQVKRLQPTPSRGSDLDEPLQKRQRVLLRYSTEAAAFGSPSVK